MISNMDRMCTFILVWEIPLRSLQTWRNLIRIEPRWKKHKTIEFATNFIRSGSIIRATYEIVDTGKVISSVF